MHFFRGKEFPILSRERRAAEVKGGIIAITGCEKTAEGYAKDLHKMPEKWREEVADRMVTGLFCNAVSLEPVGPVVGDQAANKLKGLGVEAASLSYEDPLLAAQARVALRLYDTAVAIRSGEIETTQLHQEAA